MCDPVSLTVAATAVAALGQGYSALSANVQGRYEAKVASQNAHLEEGRAKDALQRGTTEAIRYGKQLSQAEGEQNAALAANGIDIGFGSAAAVRSDMARAGQEDSLTIYKNAAREAQGYEINAANYRSEALADKAKAKGAIVSGLFNIGSTVLGGATQTSKLRAAQNFGV
ncbi:virion core protein, T7 gp14 family [Sphingomonas sp. URHD0057]|uniref:virion core protein, T7 gp14 family n=1 Tax=Sphingomonas sp. URHD0057 TaxID=1380389 RepID=UPI00048BEBDF|nr:hypothetical protein [Sphingomonas sp. URHD0057]